MTHVGAQVFKLNTIESEVLCIYLSATTRRDISLKDQAFLLGSNCPVRNQFRQASAKHLSGNHVTTKHGISHGSLWVHCTGFRQQTHTLIDGISQDAGQFVGDTGFTRAVDSDGEWVLGNATLQG